MSVYEEKMRYLNEHTDFTETIFNGLVGYGVIAADFDGTIIAYNKGASLIYGYSKEEIIGRLGLEALFPDDFMKAGGLQEIIDKLLKDGRHTFELENIKKSGESFPAKMSLTLVRSEDGRELGLVNIVQDLTEIRQAENEIRRLNQVLEHKVIERTAQLQESEERFRAVAESAGDAIICLRKTDTVYLWNKKAEEIFGFSAQEAIGMPLHKMIIPEKYRIEAEKGLDLFTRTGGGPIVGKRVELSALRKDGTELPVELSVSAMKTGNEWHSIGIIRDITARKEAERKLKEYVSELERFQRATIQREFRIKELKDRIDTLEKK